MSIFYIYFKSIKLKVILSNSSRKTTIFIIIVFLGLKLQGQNEHLELPKIIPPSPNAYELSKVGQIPVGLFTGALNLNIPLINYKSKNLEVPISLNYNSNGIKVDQTASIVGLGWNLNAGGVISRIVRDKDDQENLHYFPESDMVDNKLGALKVKYFIEASQGADSEPDLYLFNFNGYSGQFVFDNNNTDILLMPAQALDIKTIVQGNDDGFQITTPDGSKYIFLAGETTESRIYNAGQHNTPEFVKNAWYLTKIIYHTGEHINFYYSNTNYSYISARSESVDVIPTQGGCQNKINPTNTFPIKRIEHFSHVMGKQLDSITSNNAIDGKIIFYYNHPDHEIIGYNHVSTIEYKNMRGEIINKIDFTYLPPMSNQRCFLKGINFKDSTNYDFEYLNPQALPKRLSYSQDHWGYFNNKVNSTLVPKPYDDILYNGFTGAADRNVDTLASQQGLLNKIVYPTKGTSEIIYEAHSYHGKKEIPAITSNVTLNAIRDMVNPLTDSLVLDSPQTQYIKFIVNTWPYSNSNSSYCNSPETTGHETSSLTVFDITSGNYVELLLLSYGQYVPRGNGTFTPTGGKECYAYLKKDHSYRIELTANGICTETSARITYLSQAATSIYGNLATGGSRVKKTILNNSSGSHPEVSRYYYSQIDGNNNSSGDCGKLPNYLSITESIDICSQICSYVLVTHHILNSSSLLPLFSSGNSNIYYKYVAISNGGDNFENGGSEHEFIVNRDVPGHSFGKHIQNAPLTNSGWNNGIEKEVKYFANHNGKLCLIKKVENNDTTDSRLYKEAFGYSIRKNYDIYCSQPSMFVCSEEETTRFHTIIYGTDTMYLYHPCFGHSVGDTVFNTDNIRNLDIISYKLISWWTYRNRITTTEYDLSGNELIKSTQNFFYDNEAHLQLSREEISDSKGITISNNILYPDDITDVNSLSGGILSSEDFNNICLLKKDSTHRIAVPIQKEMFVNESRVRTLRNLFGIWNNLILPSKVLSSETSNPLETKIFFSDYDENGNLLSNYKNQNIPFSYLYGYNKRLPVAEVSNAFFREIDFNGFENDEINEWQKSGEANFIVDSINVRTGKGSLLLNNCTLTKSYQIGELAAYHQGYIFSVWVKGSSSVSLRVYINDENTPTLTSSNAVLQIGDWKKFEVNLLCSLIESKISSSMKLRISFGTTGTAYFDDLRFHPSDARMTTYTHEPLIGITSSSDANNRKTTYEYDGFGRLKLVKDYLGNILKKYDYNYKTTL